MSTTKVTDALRTVTEVDAAKITTGTIPEARITTLDSTKLTGTVADARLPATALNSNVDLTTLSASNLTTGTVDVARLPSTVLNSNVPATDTSALEMNIAVLAFKLASSNQLSKFSMVDQVIDEYQDATGIDAGASTNELTGGATTAKYYEGGTEVTITQDADATGTDGDYTWYKWTDTSSTGSYVVSGAETIEYLVVAGGGSGSHSNNGAGGAGGLIATTGVSYTASSTWTITVGAGGAASATLGNNGANSIISGSGLSTQTAIGGGRGGSGGIGLEGGSGGGNAQNISSTPAAGTVGQGNSGGNAGTGAPHYGAGGGGGAGGVGVNGTSASSPRSGGDGGVGLQNDITGTNTYYAGGGGGSSDGNVTEAGNGGLGGGGHGDGVSGSSSQADKDGDANTGGGGGAGHWHGSGTTGAGGSGVVIIRRLTAATSSGGDLTLQSVATTAESAPTSADLVVLIEDGVAGGPAAVNTDIKGYVSRNGSAFSTAVTFVDEGDWGTNKRILVARNIDISGITTGTAMKYKLTTHNQVASSKETRIHATSLAWA